MRNGIRMVVTDLDGTLLRDDKTISAYTEAVIARLRASGVSAGGAALLLPESRSAAVPEAAAQARRCGL